MQAHGSPLTSADSRYACEVDVKDAPASALKSPRHITPIPHLEPKSPGSDSSLLQTESPGSRESCTSPVGESADIIEFSTQVNHLADEDPPKR